MGFTYDSEVLDGAGQRRPPEHLSAESREIWENLTVAKYGIDDAATVVLRTLCEAWDRRREARAVIARDGLVVKDRFGITKSHPMLAIERDQTLAIQRAFRLLGFDQAPRGDSRQGDLF